MISYSKNSEDVVLARVFRDVERGFYVDVGVKNPNEQTLTRHFYEKGWQGINVEPGPEFKKFVRARPRDITLNLTVSDRNDSTEKTLAEIFTEHSPPQIDFLSIGEVGSIRAVLAGNDWNRFRPRLILLRAIDLASDEPLHNQWEDILIKENYRCALFDGLNRFYLRQEDETLATRLYPACLRDRCVPWSMVRLLDQLHGVGALPEYPDHLPDTFDIDDLSERLEKVLRGYREYQQMTTGIGPKGLHYGLGVTRKISQLTQKIRRLLRGGNKKLG